MKSIVLFAVLIATCYARPESPASLAAGPGAIPKPAKLVCAGKHLAPEPAVIAAIQECKKSDRFGDGEGKLNSNCAAFCVEKALGLSNSDFTPFNGDQLASWAAETFPDNQVAAAQEHFRNCYDTFGKGIELNDATCAHAAAFDACLWQLQPNTSCPAKA